MAPVKGFIFDLDDTLCMEREYVRSGFMAVGCIVSDRCGMSADVFFQRAWAFFEGGVRGNIFSMMLKEYPEISRHFCVSNLVSAYREHIPNIKMHESAIEVLNFLRCKNKFLGLISDGYYVVQKNKIEALFMQEFFDHIVLTDIYGREFWKPHERAFLDMEHVSGLKESELIYIADNPQKDFIAPRNRNWRTLRAVFGGQVHSFENVAVEQDAELIVHGFEEWRRVLRSLSEVADA